MQKVSQADVRGTLGEELRLCPRWHLQSFRILYTSVLRVSVAPLQVWQNQTGTSCMCIIHAPPLILIPRGFWKADSVGLQTAHPGLQNPLWENKEEGEKKEEEEGVPWSTTLPFLKPGHSTTPPPTHTPRRFKCVSPCGHDNHFPISSLICSPANFQSPATTTPPLLPPSSSLPPARPPATAAAVVI